MTDVGVLKAAVGAAAAELVESGMRVGLGTGSTANPFVEAVGRRLERGEITDVVGVATSVATARLAERVGIPIDGLDGQPLDLAVDGADEIGPGLDLIKGLGGAHLREKVVAARARRFVVIADDSKLVPAMGSRSPVPLEVAEFGLPATAAELEDLGEPILRVHEGRATMTDNGNPIIDLWTGQIADPQDLDARLHAIPGVLATGLFVAMAELAIVAGDDGLLYLDRTHQG